MIPLSHTGHRLHALLRGVPAIALALLLLPVLPRVASLHAQGGDMGEMILEGEIQAISYEERVVVVQDQRIWVPLEARIVTRRGEEPIRFADLEVGQFVTVHAGHRPHHDPGPLVAHLILVGPPLPPPILIVGEIQAISYEERVMVVRDHRIVVPRDALILRMERHHRPIPFEELHVGDWVEVHAVRESDDAPLVARVIIVGHPMPPPPPPVVLSGEIQEISHEERSLVVEDRLVMVPREARIVERGRRGRPISFEELEVGIFVTVRGHQEAEDQPVIARMIWVGEGSISAIPSLESEGAQARIAADLPRALALGPNYPNPFNPSTTIPYTVPARPAESADAEAPQAGAALVPVSLRLYTLRGALVRTLVEGEQAPGEYVIQWDGRDQEGALIPSGIYLARLASGERAVMRRLVVAK